MDLKEKNRIRSYIWAPSEGKNQKGKEVDYTKPRVLMLNSLLSHHFLLYKEKREEKVVTNAIHDMHSQKAVRYQIIKTTGLLWKMGLVAKLQWH